MRWIAAVLYVAVLVALHAAAARMPDPAGLEAVVVALGLPASLIRPPLELGLARAAPEAVRQAGPYLAYAEITALGLLNALLLGRLYRLLPAAPAAAEVDRRLGEALVAAGVPVTPMAHERGLRAAGDGMRLTRSLLLRDVPVPYPQLLGVYREQWLRAGLRVQERADPPAVRAYDADDYEYLLEPGPGPAWLGEAVLRVASPVRGRGAFWGGLLTALTPVVLLAGTVAVVQLGATGAADPVLAVAIPLGWVLILVGPGSLALGIVLLTRLATRAFGRGMVLGGVPGALAGGLLAVTFLTSGW